LINWQKTVISPDTSIYNAMKQMDDAASQICLVIDENGYLLGTVTDGDIRRGLLAGVTLGNAIKDIMFTNPHTTTSPKTAFEMLEKLYATKKIRHLPILDGLGRVIGVASIEGDHKHENWVFLLAGGLGTRLRPLTNDIPKPMLKVGDKPILEQILLSLISQGFYKFFISVSYKADVIIDYFGDGSQWNVQILYIHEKETMGTAGSLSLIPIELNEPLLVMNGDLVTKADFTQILHYHASHGLQATMCVREYDFQVPFGVVITDEYRMLDIEEKPIHNFLVNAGIYVLSPNSLSYIPKSGIYDMPSLFKDMISNGETPVVYPIYEYWVDVGRIEEFARVNKDFNKTL
jgi:dTDP-glucose pyrophosphorylase